MNKKLKVALLESGMHQYEVAKRAGLSETDLSRLVTGRRPPTRDELCRLAAALGLRVQDLGLNEEGDDPNLAEVTSNLTPSTATRTRRDAR